MFVLLQRDSDNPRCSRTHRGHNFHGRRRSGHGSRARYHFTDDAGLRGPDAAVVTLHARGQVLEPARSGGGHGGDEAVGIANDGGDFRRRDGRGDDLAVGGVGRLVGDAYCWSNGY